MRVRRAGDGKRAGGSEIVMKRVNVMKLFDDYEAVKFPEEYVFFSTNRGFLYYFYQPRYICRKVAK